MSVYHQSFVVYGWDLGGDIDPYEIGLMDEYDWRDRSEGEVACVYDGRGTRFCYFGVVVAATNSTRDGPQDFGNQYTLDEQEIDLDKLYEVGRVLGELGIDVEGDSKFHVFTQVK